MFGRSKGNGYIDAGLDGGDYDSENDSSHRVAAEPTKASAGSRKGIFGGTAKKATVPQRPLGLSDSGSDFGHAVFASNETDDTDTHPMTTEAAGPSRALAKAHSTVLNILKSPRGGGGSGSSTHAPVDSASPKQHGSLFNLKSPRRAAAESACVPSMDILDGQSLEPAVVERSHEWSAAVSRCCGCVWRMCGWSMRNT